jgi:hypothetical protein
MYFVAAYASVALFILMTILFISCARMDAICKGCGAHRDGNAKCGGGGDGPGNLHITRPSNQLLEAPRGQVATRDVCSCTEL